MHRLHAHIHHKSHIIWDWNGTLLDDTEICVATIQEITARYQIPEVTLDEYRRIFRFPVIEYYRDLGFDLERVSFAELTRQFVSGYRARLSKARLFEGTTELLQDLAGRGARSMVLSAAQEDDLRTLLRDHAIDHHFMHVCGLGDHYAASKLERGRQLLAELRCPREEIILIGDTDHDLEVGRSLGIDVLLVDGGHQHIERLALHGVPVVRRL